MKRFKLPDRRLVRQTCDADPILFYYKPIVGYFYQTRIERCLELIPNTGFRRILEIGTGSGVMIPSLAEFADQITAIDIHDELSSLREIKNTYSDSCNIGFARADVVRLPFASGSFDMAVAISVFEHFEQLDSVLKETVRVLKPGGLLLAGIPVKSSTMSALFKLIGYSLDDLHPSSHTKIIDSVKKHFSVIKTNSLTLFPKGPEMYFGMLASVDI